MDSGSFSITDNNTSATIVVTGMTAGGHIAISQLPPTGGVGDTIIQESYSSNQVVVSVDSAPGVGKAYNFRFSVLRLS